MLGELFTNTATGFLIVLALVLGLLLWLAIRQPVLARLGVRNIPRRPAQSVLIVVGLTLSTIIFVTSFALGDTLNYSIQRQAIEAFGKIDQIVAPPLLSLLTSFGAAPNPPSGDGVTVDNGQSQGQNVLEEGGLDSLLALLDEGLPGITTERYEKLRKDLAGEPLIDGVAPSIIFPTIIRDVNTGQGEPLGFIVAIDDSYSTEFGLHNQDGELVKASSLRPGVGNIFELTANLFSLAGQQTQQLGLGEFTLGDVVRAVDQLGRLANTPITDTTALAAIVDELGVPGLISRTTGISATSVLSLAQQLGITNTALLNANLSNLTRQLGISDTTLLGLAPLLTDSPAATNTQTTSAISPTLTDGEGLSATLDSGSVISQTPAIRPTSVAAIVDQAAEITETTRITPSSSAPASALPATAGGSQPPPAIGANLLSMVGLEGLTGAELFERINLNTLGQELDQLLGQYGLQLRQGEIFLGELAADRLNARVGDTIEIYVGPIPLPYRVKGIVKEAGPAGALAPVVMMRLDEAQRLLFMEGKVNNLLISQKGDEMEGVQYTAEAAQRLRVLSLNEEALNKIVTTLRTDASKQALDQEIERIAREGIVPLDEDVPAVVGTILNSFVGGAVQLQDLRTLRSELDQPTITPALREVIAQDEMRFFLTELSLPSATRDALNDDFNQLGELLVIEQLSKQTVITAGNVVGQVFSVLFTLFGIFSILAGVMLIFLIFVMMAAERRSEMGMARAVGVQRGQLVQMFVTEGMIYDLLAAALGLLLGIGIAWLMVGFVSGLFNDVSSQFGANVNLLRFRFSVAPTSMIIAYCLGVLLTFLVVTWSSWRVSRLNIVTAIRNLPDEASARPRGRLAQLWRWSAGPLLIAAGAVVAYQGLNGAQTYYQLGATLILWGLSMLVTRLLERTALSPDRAFRIPYTLLGVGLLIVWAIPWNRLQGRSTFDLFANEQGWLLAGFTLQAPMLILGAILAVMANADTIFSGISRLLGNIGSLTPVLKMAVAYPLAARFRTAMAMVMFAMIIATVVIMAVVIAATQSIVVQDDKDTGGFEISTSFGILSLFDPISDLAEEISRQSLEEYPRLADIAAVGGIGEQRFDLRQSGGSQAWRERNVAVVTSGYITQALQIYPFAARAAGFADDAAVWNALATGADVAIISKRLLPATTETEQSTGRSGGFDEFEGRRGRSFVLNDVTVTGDQLPELFLELRLQDGVNNRVYKVQVIGLLADDTTLAGQPIQVSTGLVERMTGTRFSPSAWYVKVKPEATAEVKAVAQEVERAFLSSSLDATVVAESFAQGQAITRGILRLLQGFLGLGLLVGIAALGVISSRSVVERRQQVGMLRAIGFQPRMVALAFLLEASFIALTGLLVGALTGVLLGENIVRTLFSDLTPQTQFAVPWGQIGLILLIAYGFSLLTTILPALQAARIYPAEALRYD